MVREITQREAEKQNLLAHHITQSWQWGQFRLQTGVPKILRLGFFDGNNLKRVYQVFFHQAPYLNRLIAYLPRTESPPPDDLSVISEICKKNRAVFLKLEPEGKIDLSFGQPILPENSLLVDLNQPVDDLLASMHEKTRYNIRLAQKSGVVVTAKTDADSLTTFINLYDATQKRQGFFAKSGNYLKTLWNVLSPTKMVHLLMAEVEGEPVAAGMFFHFVQVIPHLLSLSLTQTQIISLIFWFLLIVIGSFILAGVLFPKNFLVQLLFTILYSFNIYLFNSWENVKVANLSLVSAIPFTLWVLIQLRNKQITFKQSYADFKKIAKVV